MDITKIRWTAATLALMAAVSAGLMGQQGAPGRGAAAPAPANGTDPAEIAEGLKKLQHGPQLPNKLVANWPTLPKGYNMGEATGVDIDRQGNVWVANRGSWPVMEFDRSGKMLQAWSHDAVRVTEGTGKGTHGDGDGQFNLPHGVTMDSNGRIYVADRANSRMQVFDNSGKFLAKWTDIGQPWDVYYAAKENALYAVDGRWCRITKIDTEGKVVGELGHFGHGPGELDFPHAIAVTADGSEIYVVEIKNWRVQKWAR
jgi:DNA-binding beta-propeller fold protein YncE